MKKLLALVLISGFTMSLSAVELGQKDSRCIYTKCEMDRSSAKELTKNDPVENKQGKKHRKHINQ